MRSIIDRRKKDVNVLEKRKKGKEPPGSLRSERTKHRLIVEFGIGQLENAGKSVRVLVREKFRVGEPLDLPPVSNVYGESAPSVRLGYIGEDINVRDTRTYAIRTFRRPPPW